MVTAVSCCLGLCFMLLLRSFSWFYDIANDLCFNVYIFFNTFFFVFVAPSLGGRPGWKLAKTPYPRGQSTPCFIWHHKTWWTARHCLALLGMHHSGCWSFTDFVLWMERREFEGRWGWGQIRGGKDPGGTGMHHNTITLPLSGPSPFSSSDICHF